MAQLQDVVAYEPGLRNVGQAPRQGSHTARRSAFRGPHMFDKRGKTRPPHRHITPCTKPGNGSPVHRRGALYSEHRAPRACARFATRVRPSRWIGGKVRPAPPAKFALSPGTLAPSRKLSLVAAFFRHPPPGTRLWHSYGPGTPRPLGYQYDHGVYPCSQSRRERGSQSGRCADPGAQPLAAIMVLC